MRAPLRWSLVALCVLVVALLALQVALQGRVTALDGQASAYWMAHRTEGMTVVMRLTRSNRVEPGHVRTFRDLAYALAGQEPRRRTRPTA